MVADDDDLKVEVDRFGQLYDIMKRLGAGNRNRQVNE